MLAGLFVKFGVNGTVHLVDLPNAFDTFEPRHDRDTPVHLDGFGVGEETVFVFKHLHDRLLK